MLELFVRGKNTIDPEVIDPGGRSVEISPVKSDFTFTFYAVFWWKVIKAINITIFFVNIM
jgi:hypothetical protein